MQLPSPAVMLEILGQLQCIALSICMAIDQLIQRLITQETRNADEEKHDLDILLNHISNLEKAGKTLVEEFDQEQQRCDRQTQFIVSLSRRVRESMSIVRGSAWMLDVHGNHIKAETRRKHYSTIRSAIMELGRQLHLVQLWQDHMFDVKPILGELEKFGLCAIEYQVHDSIDLLSKQSRNHKPSSKLRFEPHVLKMILDEVLENAIKFSNGTKPVECHISWSARQVKISVRDYGIGIPDTEKLNVFKSFYRAPNAAETEGYGLGLSIVRKLVSDYRGTISLKSKLGKGTEIIISIPLDEAETRSPDPRFASLWSNPCPT